MKPLGLLRERPGVRNLWLALALSYTGSGASLTALTLYAQRTQGTGIAVAAIVVALTIPRLLGPVAGTLADRWDLRRLMVALFRRTRNPEAFTAERDTASSG